MHLPTSQSRTDSELWHVAIPRQYKCDTLNQATGLTQIAETKKDDDVVEPAGVCPSDDGADKLRRDGARSSVYAYLCWTTTHNGNRSDLTLQIRGK